MGRDGQDGANGVVVGRAQSAHGVEELTVSKSAEEIKSLAFGKVN